MQVFRNLSGFVVAVFNAIRMPPPHPGVIELDDNVVPVNQPTRHIPPVDFLYANQIILRSESKQRNVERPAKARRLERPLLPRLCLMVERVVPKS